MQDSSLQEWNWDAWRADEGVGLLTGVARCFWFEVLGVMWKSGQTGELSGSIRDLAILSRLEEHEVSAAIREIQSRNVAEISVKDGIFTLGDRAMKRRIAHFERVAERRRRDVIRMRRFRERGGGDPLRWVVIRRRILARDRRRCVYCGGEANTVDHIKPRSAGGDHSDSNLVAACRKCNSRKGKRTPEEAGMQFRRRTNHGGTEG